MALGDGTNKNENISAFGNRKSTIELHSKCVYVPCILYKWILNGAFSIAFYDREFCTIEHQTVQTIHTKAAPPLLLLK